MGTDPIILPEDPLLSDGFPLAIKAPEGFTLAQPETVRPPRGFTLTEPEKIKVPEGFTLSQSTVKVPEGFTLAEPSKNATKVIDVNSMENFKVSKMLGALPPAISEAVKIKAIERQRAKLYGTITMEEPSLFNTLVEGSKNIPRNTKEIIKSMGSLVVDIGRFGFKFKDNYIADLNALFVTKDTKEFGHMAKQFEPAFDLAADVLSDWRDILGGITPEALAKRPSGEYFREKFQEIEEGGARRFVYGFIRERPVDALLIGSVAKSALGEGMRLTATGARKIMKNGSKFADSLDNFLSTKRNPIVYKMPVETAEGVEVGKSIKFPRKYSRDPISKYTYQKGFDFVLDKFPELKEAIANKNANKLLGAMRTTYDDANFKERVKLHSEISKNLGTLTPKELEIMVPYLEGRASLIATPSAQFQAFEGWYRNLAKNIFEDVTTKGAFSPSVARDRLYQPLAKATGLTTDQVIAEFGDFIPAYVHHFFPETYPAKMSIHFADTTGRRFSPGFAKKSFGVAGYSENLSEILPKWTSEYIKFKNTEAYLAAFTSKFGTPVNLNQIKNVKGGLQTTTMVNKKPVVKTYRNYGIVAPDGYLNFYKGKIDFYKEVSKRLDDMTFDEAMGEVLSETVARTAAAFKGVEKSYVGVAKNKRVYLVPNEQIKQLESMATPLFGSQKVQNFVKIWYDTPVGVWKDSVLAISPRWIKNNAIGDIIFNTFDGTGLFSYTKAFNKKYTALIPDEILEASFANVMKYNPKLGLAAKSTVGSALQRLKSTKAVKGVAAVKDFGYALNTAIEQIFVRALYINKARQKAVQLLKTEGLATNEANILAKMNTIKNNPNLIAPIIKEVKETLPVFNTLGNFERKYLRRAAPFYNWYKFMVNYGVKLPTKHPFRTAGARGLAAMSENHREEAFAQTFPWMKDTIDYAGIPDRYDNLWPISGEDKNGEAVFFNSRGLNPFTTLEDLLELKVVNLMSPIIKIPIERGTGIESFTGRKYRTGEEGAEDFKMFEKIVPPIGEHILRQFPQYTLLKESITPGRQWDSGTAWNPDPIVDEITGEYKYPIESVEKWLNFVGVDKKTLDIRRTWENYQSKKRAKLGETFKKYQVKAPLSLNDIQNILNEIRQDNKKWGVIINKIQQSHLQKTKEKRKLVEVLRKD